MLRKTKLKITPERMVELRRSGVALPAIAREAGICRTHAGRIVKRHAPELGRRMKKRNRKKEFTGVDLDPAVKDSLRHYVRQNNQSISGFIAGAVEEKLKALGVEITRAPINRGEPLPFGE